MKNLKQVTKTICFLFAIFLLSIGAYAQPTTITLYNGGSAYLCAGQEYILSLPSGPPNYYSVASPLDWQWGCCTNFNGSNPPSYNYINDLEVKGWANSNLKDTVVALYGSTSTEVIIQTPEGNVTFTLQTYYAQINGTTMLCESNSPFSFTSTTNVSSPTYSWTCTAACWTPTTVTTSANVTYSTATACNGVLTLVVSGDGCPNNSGTNMALNVGDGTLNETQTGLISWSRAGVSCEYDANVSPVPGATSYQWSFDGSTVAATTTAPKLTGGQFDYSTTYHIWVRVLDACSSSYGPWSTEHTQTTPGKPPGCAQDPIKPIEEEYKVYPNPANNQLTIEYPTVSDNSALSVNVYDMLGHKMATWSLPSSGNTATENTSALPTGMYLYIINSGDDIVKRGKVMIQK